MARRIRFADLGGLVAQLRSNIFRRWMSLAQKRALIWWQQRRQAPGLLARFTKSGNAFYGFAKRASSYRRRKGNLPDFIFTGRLRDALMQRKPVSLHGGQVVRTVLKIGGGSLNFLKNKVPLRAVPSTIGYVTTQVGAYTRTTPRGTAQVVSHRRRVPHATRNPPVPAGRSYGEEFSDLSKDMQAIQTRVMVEFRRIVARMAYTKRGGLRSSVVDPADQQQEASA
jgi:hypothetical protein